MTTFDRVLLAVSVTLCVLAVMFGLAAIAFPDFRDTGPAIAGTILGALVTMCSVIVGTQAAARMTNGKKENGNGTDR